MDTRFPHRVVITGVGAISPNGIGREAFWQACLQGRSGIRQIEHFDASALPTQIAGEVPVFSPATLGVGADEIEHLDRVAQFAIAASHLAFSDSGLCDPSGAWSPTFQHERCGVFLGSGIATTPFLHQWYLQQTQQKRTLHPAAMQPTTLMMASHPATAVAAHHHLYGACTGHTTACSSGADAIGQAFWEIQEGRATWMLAGGCDAPINPIILNSLSIIHALSTNNTEPEQASRPYDATRNGFVLSEGAGVLVLEDRDAALERHATIYAELIAYATNNNGYHMTALPQDGKPLRDIFYQAMHEAQVGAQDIGYINAHGSATLPNDRYETTAYKATFGAYAAQIPISSTKSMIGHSQGAASALETIVTALALYHQILPPTINLAHPDPFCDLDYVPNRARPARLQTALTHSSGFGGINTALLLAHPAFRSTQQSQVEQ